VRIGVIGSGQMGGVSGGYGPGSGTRSSSAIPASPAKLGRLAEQLGDSARRVVPQMRSPSVTSWPSSGSIQRMQARCAAGGVSNRLGG